MVSGRRPSNSKAPDVVRYGGMDHAGPASIFRSALRPPAVSLATFSARFRRLAEADTLSSEFIDEALWLNADEFKHKYGARRTLVELDGQPTDLQVYYSARAKEAAVDYRNFWQRARALAKERQLFGDALTHALTLPPAIWRSFYGGGRRKGFVYQGDEYPEHAGRHFHSVSSLLHTLDRYNDRALVWSRLKAGWNLDNALAVPAMLASHRSGSIYQIIRRKTGAVYVGLTVTSVEQRWFFHIRAATGGSTTKFHAAIREDGAEGFDVELLEAGITDPAVLSAREAFWIEQLGALGTQGLNTAKPGGLGGPGGKRVEYGHETFRSIEEAVDILSVRLGIARHVIRSRIQKGQPIPKPEKVRRHSNHPDAGSNLFRRWLGMLKRHVDGVALDWTTDYERFKADVSPVPASMELVRKRPNEAWGPDNFEWVSTQTKIERVHGQKLTVKGTIYPSLAAVARAHGIGVSTLKNRINEQGMSVEEAIAAPLGFTSYKQVGKLIMVDEREFRSKRQAIRYIAETRGITEDQAKYRFSIGAI